MSINIPALTGGGATEARIHKSKTSVSAHIRLLDNGYLLSVNKDTKDGYESVEIAITSLPKLLKAIGTIFKEISSNEEE
jgi:hypothetical protein